MRANATLTPTCVVEKLRSRDLTTMPNERNPTSLSRPPLQFNSLSRTDVNSVEGKQIKINCAARQQINSDTFKLCCFLIEIAYMCPATVQPTNTTRTFCLLCFLPHAVSVAFLHCTTQPFVLLHVVACPAQSLSVCTFTNFEGAMISIRLFALGAPFKYLTIRFRFISSLSVGHVILS